MTPNPFETSDRLWQAPEEAIHHPVTLFHLVLVGLAVGLLAGSVIAIFRITSGFAYTSAIKWTGEGNLWLVICWIILALGAGLWTGYLIKNPAIRFGGADWINAALENGQPKVWKVILLPKFIGSWLVMAMGVSVGREGPCIQMGASTALGMHRIGLTQRIERRFFIVGGGAAGLAAAFSAPFAGICYVYEVMKQQLDRSLFIFMLAGGIGVYISCTQIFGLGTMLPMEKVLMPDLGYSWILIPLGLFTGIVGIAYNYLLRLSKLAWTSQKLIPLRYRPVLTFLAAAIMVLVFPAVTGEGLDIFPAIEAGKELINFLIFFLLVKLFFTAFCYGSGIPAGIMVPVLCLGGVTGGIYALGLEYLGISLPDQMLTCMVIGMAGAFAAAEKAPVTAVVLVAEMTGAYSITTGLLAASAIASFLGKLVNVRRV